MAKAKRSSRRRYADMLWSRVINERDKFCQMADDDCDGRLEAAHILGKQMGGARYATRWDPDNGVLLCQVHHRRFDGVFDKWRWAEERLGEQRWAELQDQALQKWDRDYDKVIEMLRGLLAGQVQAHHGTPARSVPVPQADSPSREG